jgi:hypothetical protein
LFVAVGAKTIITSSNGITWTKQTTETSNEVTWYDITYGNNLYVAVWNNTVTILTSPDSTTWTKQTTDSSSPLNKVLYWKNMFVIMGAGKIFNYGIFTLISLL